MAESVAFIVWHGGLAYPLKLYWDDEDLALLCTLTIDLDLGSILDLSSVILDFHRDKRWYRRR